MTKDEALRLALEALDKLTDVFLDTDGTHGDYERNALDQANKAITTIKAALANEALERKAENARELGLDYEPLEAKDEPDKYAMDIECTKCGAKQSGVLTVHTTPPQQKAKDEPWEKFCDSNCVWTDHHPDCKLAQRTWVGLTDKDWSRSKHSYDFQKGVDWAEAMLKGKNT